MWRNWSGEQACIPAATERPRSTEEVAAAVRRAGEEGRTVRVAGAGHSFNDIVITDGVLLSLDAMGRVLDVDRDRGLVRVQAGIRLAALSDELDRHGLALENMGDINAQSLAGALATGTHGAGAGLGNLSAQVAALQLVDGDGTVHELEGGDTLLAARVSMGALGVVTEVTLRCLPAYVLRGVDAPCPLGEVLERMDELAAAHRHFEFYVFPHTEIALTRTNEVVDGPARPPGRVARWADDVLLTNHLFRLACETGRRFPRAIPRLNRLAAGAVGERTRVDRSDRIFATPRLVRFVETELAFPAAAGRAALEEILAATRRHPVNFPIEARFVAPDDALLSPASGRAILCVSVHVYRGMPWEALFRAVHEIGEAHDARPHWGKRHFHTAETLRPRYPGWERFQAVRRALDPGDRFTNAYVRRTLG